MYKRLSFVLVYYILTFVYYIVDNDIHKIIVSEKFFINSMWEPFRENDNLQVYKKKKMFIKITFVSSYKK